MNDEMNDYMYFKVQKTLEKQLQLLSELSLETVLTPLELCEVTKAMVSLSHEITEP